MIDVALIKASRENLGVGCPPLQQLTSIGPIGCIAQNGLGIALGLGLSCGMLGGH